MMNPTAAQHFKLVFCATVHHIIEQVAQSFGSREAVFEEFPFLIGYWEEDLPRKIEQLHAFEASTPQHLPLRALANAAGMDHHEVLLMLAIGLVEEDARFGILFETVLGVPGQHRPTLGLLDAWWRQTSSAQDLRPCMHRSH